MLFFYCHRCIDYLSTSWKIYHYPSLFQCSLISVITLFSLDQFKKAGLSIFCSNWFNIHDFTPVDGENNWSLLSEGVTVQSYVPNPANDDYSAVKISTDPESSVVPLTRGSRTKNYDEVVLV